MGGQLNRGFVALTCITFAIAADGLWVVGDDVRDVVVCECGGSVLREGPLWSHTPMF
eukprot:m.787 g.787  ORF g.787 m.787 type:complete len:57 (-) comp309_c0_seq1:197-367(-)